MYFKNNFEHFYTMVKFSRYYLVLLLTSAQRQSNLGYSDVNKYMLDDLGDDGYPVFGVSCRVPLTCPLV